MIRRVATTGLLGWGLLAGLAAADELPRHVFAPSPEDEVQDLVFFGDERPVFLRLRVRVDDAGFRVAWSDFVERLHRFLDADGDGTLTLQEAQRGSWTQVLRSPFGPQPAVEQRVFSRLGTLTIDGSPKDGQVSLDELAHHLRESLSFSEFGLQQAPPPDTRTQAIFGLLDRDSDGTVTAAELAAADDLLTRLDRDVDEKLNADELRPDLPDSTSRQFFGQPNPTAVGADTAPFVALTSVQVRSAVMRRLMAKYGAERRLGASGLGLSETEFGRFDADGSGALDALETEGMLADPPLAAEFTALLGDAGAGGKPRVTLAARTRGPEAGPVKPNPDGSVTLDLGGAMLEVRVGDALQDLGNFLEQQFKAADSDNNGYVDKKEVAQNGLLNQFFAAADRDGDGKLFAQEMTAYAERQGDAQRSRTMLTVSDRGRALFELLDADKDGTLAIRELRRAGRRLAEVARTPEAGFKLDAIPRRYTLSLGRGSTPVQQGITIETYDSSPRPVAEKARAAPSWFRRMDRNADGDVSRREFLGPLDEFRRLDSDGDGLIDPAEAGR